MLCLYLDTLKTDNKCCKINKIKINLPSKVLAVYLLPKRTYSRKHLFISISCISIIFCVHIVKYIYKLMICWKFHIIPTRNSQEIDDWNIYLNFLGHVRLGDSANKCACPKIKNRNIRNFGFYIELFRVTDK